MPQCLASAAAHTVIVVSICCSFAQTEQYLVLMVWPCVLDPLRMVLNNSVFHDMQWKPELGVRLHVIDKRKDGKGHMATYRCCLCH